MIRHVVVFETLENAPVSEFKTKIEALKEKIPQIKHIEVGIDINYEDNSADFCVITEVENIDDLDIYAKHPDHLEVISFIKPFVKSRKVVDYKVG